MLTKPNPKDAELVSMLEAAFASVESLCGELTQEDWDKDTDCAAWSVRDQLSHITDFEYVASGGPLAPEIDREAFAHVTNDFQYATERGVEARRALSGAQVLDEYREVLAKRLPAVRALATDAAAWDATMVTPVGELTPRAILPIRLLDITFHEQDIRRATGKPGNLDADAIRFCVQRMAHGGFPFVVGKGAGAPEGTTVHLRIDGSVGGEITVGVRDGKGVVVDGGGPDVTITTDAQTFLCLLGGRWTPERARTEGTLKVEGDEALAASILNVAAVLP